MRLKGTLIASALLHTFIFSLAVAASFSAKEMRRGVFFVELKEDTPCGTAVLRPLNKKQKVVEEKIRIQEEPLTVETAIETTLVEEVYLPANEEAINAPLTVRVHRAFIEAESPSSGWGIEHALSSSVQPHSFPIEPSIKRIRDAIKKATSYPLMARKRNIEGTVLAGFYIDGRGMPSNINILKSSGSNILDDEAIRAIKMASPYPVLKERIEVPINFRLKAIQSP